MKWTAEGKKVGDKVAFFRFRHSPEIALGVITGETQTRWKIDDDRYVRKDSGKFVGNGEKYSYAFDADQEAMKGIAEQHATRETNSRFHLIRNWVDSMRRFEDDKQTVVDLLWPIVEPLLAKEKA